MGERSSVEVILRIEDRTITVDLEDNSLQGLRAEFNELCEEDEALRSRRLKYAPTYSIFHQGLQKHAEIKRKHKFANGEMIFIGWSPLALQDDTSASSQNLETPQSPTEKSKPSQSVEQGTEMTEHRLQLNKASNPQVAQTSASQAKRASSSIQKKQPNEMDLAKTEMEKAMARYGLMPTPQELTKGHSSNQSIPQKQKEGSSSASSRGDAGAAASRGGTSSTNKAKECPPSASNRDDAAAGGSRAGTSSTNKIQLFNTSKKTGNTPLTNSSTPDEKSQEETDSQDDDWYGEVKEYYVESEWKKLPKALKRREKNRFEIHEEKCRRKLITTPFEAQEMGAISAQDTTKKSKSRGKGLPEKLRRSSRHKQPEIENNKSSDSDDISDIECSSDPDDPKPSSSKRSLASKIQSGKTKRRKPNFKPRRRPGQELVGSRLMPKLSDNSIASIKSGKPNMSAILSDIRNHIESHCGCLYITSGERDAMSQGLVKIYPELADADNPAGHTRLSQSISASIRQRRNYLNNLKPRRIAAKAANEVKVVCQTTDKVEEYNEELKAGCTDTIRAKFLIGKTLEKREVEFGEAQKSNDPETRSKKCQDVWESYPHYKSGKLVIYEHCLHSKLQYETLSDNFKSIIEKLSKSFNMSAKTDLETLNILVSVYEEITPKVFLNPDKNVKTPIEIVDAQEAESGAAIRTYHNSHVPCVLVTSKVNDLGDEVVSRAYLKLYGTALGTIDEPTPLEVVLLLLAPYFLGSINYPDAYKSFLRFLEKYIHGALCCQTAKQKAHTTYSTFVKQLENMN